MTSSPTESLTREERIFTVSELTHALRDLVENRFGFVTVVGEISGARRPASGHVYFVLKDGMSQLKAVLFKAQQRYLREEPRDGQLVLCRGHLSVYEPRGEYQLIVDSLEAQGAGQLQLEFERLKQRLRGEGLFAPERKRPLPLLPERVVLVTSASGAAVHDFIRVARTRCPAVALAVYPVPVQGEGAAERIARAIEDLNRRYRADLLVLCRGGGSVEDLWAFNEERLARAIHASAIPVVSAVGHEIDFTIADFVADLRAPTPSAAAELVVPDQRHLAGRLDAARRRLAGRLGEMAGRLEARVESGRRVLAGLGRELDSLLLRLDQRGGELEQAMRLGLVHHQARLGQLSAVIDAHQPRAALERRRVRLGWASRQLFARGAVLIEQRRHRLMALSALLNAVSPLAVLGRGYAVVRKGDPDASVVRSWDQVTEGERLSVLLHQGGLDCEVLSRSAADRVDKADG